MRNELKWQPSRFRMRKQKLRITKDAKELAISSRLTASLALECYNNWIPRVCRGSLLDLGCGKVPFYELYRLYADDIFCVDWEGSAHGTDHVDRHCDLTKPLPLDDDSFDSIICSSVLEHLPDPTLAFREIERILRPSGFLLLNVPFMYWLHEVPHDYYRYTEFALRDFANRSGLIVQHLEPLGGAPCVLVDVFSKMVVNFPVVGRVTANLVQAVGLSVFATTAGKKLLSKCKTTMPSGYFVILQKGPENH